jgi:P-type Cu+ transporter
VITTSTTDLVIGGMTCASCAARVERKLNRLDGVSATVNFATEAARVSFPETLTVGDLIAVVERTGYTAARPAPPEAGQDADPAAPLRRDLRLRMLVSVSLAVPVVLLAMVPALQFPDWRWASLAAATPVATWGAWPFHRAAVVSALHGAATMDTLVSIGVSAAYLWSLYALFLAGGGTHPTYLEVAAGVTALILLGRYLEARAKRSAGAALRALLDLGAKQATVLRDGHEFSVPADQLGVGDHFVVRPGEKIAADGTVIGGSSAVDTSMLTGEPVSAEVGPGDAVTGGCVNVGGRLLVRATRVGADTKLAQLARLVTQAQAGKAPVQRLADRVSAVFVPAVLVIAAGTLAGWLAAGGSAAQAFTPTAILVGTGRGAQLGILIKGPEILESTRRVDTVVLDKTGTITAGRMTLTDVVAAPGVPETDLLRLAAAVESASEHPIGAAIVVGARTRLAASARATATVSAASRAPAASVGARVGDVPESTRPGGQDRSPDIGGISDFVSYAGHGVSAVSEGHAVLIGKRAWLADEWSLAVEPKAAEAAESSPSAQPTELSELAERADQAEENGHTAVFVAWDGQVRGLLTVADTIKPTAIEAVARLRELGLHPVLLTGDNERAARAVADQAGIDDVIAGLDPGGKLDAVKRLQDRHRTVAMVGDGVNDAAALAQADLGLAMGTGTDAAIEAADVTLVSGDPRAAADAIALSRKTLKTIKGNLGWAFGYNAAAIPLAASGLLNPTIAAAAMAFSSLFVVTNSLRLRRFRPGDRASWPSGPGRPLRQ